MKWVKVDKKHSDGKYLTFSDRESLGMLVRSRGRWYGSQGGEMIQVESLTGISHVCKVVPPKEFANENA